MLNKQKLAIFGVFAFLVTGWAGPSFSQTHCRMLKQRINNGKVQLSNLNKNIRSVDRSLARLENQLRTLKRRKQALLQSRPSVQNRLGHDQSIFQQSCRGRGCRKLQRRVAVLKTALNGVLDQLETIASEIRRIHSGVNVLNGNLSRIKNEYNRLNCNYLVAGQTAQSTIDRCGVLFSNWNRIQARANKLSRRIVYLRRNYAKLLRELGSMDSKLDNFYAKLQRHCSNSPEIANIQVLMNAGRKYNRIGNDLNAISRELQKAGIIRLKPVRLKHRRKRPMRLKFR